MANAAEKNPAKGVVVEELHACVSGGSQGMIGTTTTNGAANASGPRMRANATEGLTTGSTPTYLGGSDG